MPFQVSRIFKFSNFQILLFYCSLSIVNYAFSQQPYFQQNVNYNIKVTLVDTSNELNAFETIDYYNNSSFELHEIYFHLWPNAYKNDKTAWAKQQVENGSTKFYYSKESDRGYIDQLDFRVNGQNITWKLDTNNIDICVLTLNTPLAPGDHISITTPFHVKIPYSFSRLGHVGQSYQITQWYPKPAVFDKYGWHAIPYLDQGEFYSEFGTFDVFITLPKNYVVGATGDLVDGEHELTWLDSIAKATALIQTYNSKDLAFPASANENKTLHYHQEKVHDFAWFADKRFHVLKGEVELPHSKRKVTSWAMYTNADAEYWKEAIAYINDATYYYSLWNGDYPYKHVTALESALSAGGGMEYPNVTVIGPSSSAFSLDIVIAHEVGHNWFYGVLGSNERDHAWMDEGINSYNESRYVSTKYPKVPIMDTNRKFLLNTFKFKNTLHKDSYYIAYLFSAGNYLDQALDIPSPKFWEINYGTIVYCKTALMFDYMRAYLNTAEMDKTMKKYYDTWQFKHPYPDDVQHVFEKTTNKKMDCFFNDLLKTTKKLDYKIVNKKTEGASIKITIKNTGEIQGPLVLGAFESGKLIELKWEEGFTGKKTISFPRYSSFISGIWMNPIYYSSFKIDPFQEMPEINRNNNLLRAHAIFKKTEPLQFQFAAALDNPDKTQIFYMPVVGWNTHNGFMPGIAIYNHFAFPKPIEFNLMPLYSVKTNSLVGSAKISGNIFYPNNFFIHAIKITNHFSRYAFSNDDDGNYFYQRNELSANITFKKRNPRSWVDRTLNIRNIYINQPVKYYVNDISSVVYTISNKRKINPFEFKVGIEPNAKYVKSSIEAKYKISFKGKNKGIDLRLFAGKFLYTNSTYFGNYNYRMSGWNGSQDYLYDYIFLGRDIEHQDFLAQQFVETEGAFKVYTAVGSSSKWLTALNVKLFPPFKLPLGLFVDIGYAPTSDKLMYDVGIQLAIVKDVVDIYIPIKICKAMQDQFDANGYKYLQTIRFTLNINHLNLSDILVNFAR